METSIQHHLSVIERKYRVRIIYACESGSRAWGFASKDSDYDVRFLYVHPTDWYLSVNEKRDVIEYINDRVLDINGWDIRKALRLLRRSNAPLREWLYSPIVYIALNEAIEPVKELAQQAFLPESLCHHYLAMAKKILFDIKEQDVVTMKSYLYTLRPTLCCQWIIEKNSQPPMLIHKLLSACFGGQPSELVHYITHLIELKMSGEESTLIERSEIFEAYLTKQSISLESKIPKNPSKQPLDAFDQVFRHIVKNVGGGGE